MTARRTRRGARRDAGETLVEIVLTVVIIGVAVTALITGLASTATASNTNRSLVTADAIMRNLAEAVKDAASHCQAGDVLAVEPVATPAGFSTSIDPASPACPPAVTPSTLELSVVGPGDLQQTMQVVVRTP
jgi:type II secretory pathway pseudopilin PulG